AIASNPRSIAWWASRSGSPRTRIETSVPSSGRARSTARLFLFFSIVVVTLLAYQRVEDVRQGGVLPLVVRGFGGRRHFLGELVHALHEVIVLAPDGRLRLAAGHFGLERLRGRRGRERQSIEMRNDVIVRYRRRENLPERGRLLIERVHHMLAIVDDVFIVC